jgi:hypothetical protein
LSAGGPGGGLRPRCPRRPRAPPSAPLPPTTPLARAIRAPPSNRNRHIGLHWGGIRNGARVCPRRCACVLPHAAIHRAYTATERAAAVRANPARASAVWRHTGGCEDARRAHRSRAARRRRHRCPLPPPHSMLSLSHRAVCCTRRYESNGLHLWLSGHGQASNRARRVSQTCWAKRMGKRHILGQQREIHRVGPKFGPSLKL